MSPFTHEGTATTDDIVKAYLMNGYGKSKALKWLQTYYDIGVLIYVGRNDKDRPIYSCVWWT